MKRIKLLIGKDFYSDGKKVFLKDREFFNPNALFKLRTFSLLILYARGFNLKNLKKILNSFKNPVINDVVVVVGNEDEEKRVKEIKLLNGKVVVNSDPEDVLYSSIKIGLRATSRRTDFIIFHFGILKDIRRETVNKIIERILTLKKDIFVPVCNGKRGHPVIFSKETLPLLLSLRKEKGLPYLFRHFKERIEYIEVDDESILRR